MKTLLIFSLLLLGCETDKVAGESEPVGQLGYSCRDDFTCDDDLNCKILIDFGPCPGGFGCQCEDDLQCNSENKCTKKNEGNYCTPKNNLTECSKDCWGKPNCMCYSDSTCDNGLECSDDICIKPTDEQED